MLAMITAAQPRCVVVRIVADGREGGVAGLRAAQDPLVRVRGDGAVHLCHDDSSFKTRKLKIEN
jgi:hypothetical protein